MVKVKATVCFMKCLVDCWKMSETPNAYTFGSERIFVNFNPTIMPTSRSSWPGVRMLESSRVWTSLSSSFFNLYTFTYSLSARTNECNTLPLRASRGTIILIWAIIWASPLYNSWLLFSAFGTAINTLAIRCVCLAQCTELVHFKHTSAFRQPKHLVMVRVWLRLGQIN